MRRRTTEIAKGWGDKDAMIKKLPVLAFALLLVLGAMVGAFGPNLDPGALRPALAAATADNCGYTGTSTVPTAPRSTLVFNESTMAKGIGLGAHGGTTTINGFYSDEHALTLGQTITNTNPPFLTTPWLSEYTQSGTNKVAGD